MKTGFIAIVGRANVGKSTLLNSIIGEKISIVSNKPQTTRNRIKGIYNRADMQLVFVDTPGLHIPHNKLGEHMIKEINSAMTDIDVVLMVVDSKPARNTELKLLERIKKIEVPVILVINKVDITKKTEVATCIASYAQLYPFASIIPISALRKDGVEIIMDELAPFLKDDGIQFYPDDIATDQTVRQMTSEIVREKILRNMYDEVPHGVAVEPLIFKERTNKNGDPVTDIVMDIICEREAHKGMIIGKNGDVLKKMATEAREDMEDIVGTKVNLQCFVKVRENWRDSEQIIAELHMYDE